MIDDHRAGLILWEMVQTSRIFQTAGQRNTQQGLAGTKFGFLQYLREHDARLNELANQFLVSAPVASRATHYMEEEGLVIRTPDPQDARAQLISITDHGRKVLSDNEGRVVRDFAAALADWSEQDAEQVRRILHQLNDHLRHVLPRSE